MPPDQTAQTPQSQPEKPAPRPYGDATAVPPMASPGQNQGTSAKIWGILLLILGLWAVINFLISFLAPLAGVDTSGLLVGITGDVREAAAIIVEEMYEQRIGRWTFWLTYGMELPIGIMSILAGWWLLIKPRRFGRKLALIRALLVLVLLPFTAFEAVTQAQHMVEAQSTIYRQVYEEEFRQAGVDPSDRDDFPQTMELIMDGAVYGVTLFSIVAMLVINALLVFFMTRPGIRQYLDDCESGKAQGIPLYNATMGMPGAPPPGSVPPPGNQDPPQGPQ
jgi:hypothetical protein